MDAIHEFLQSLGNHLEIATAIGLAIWAPIAWFLILALFRPKPNRLGLPFRITLFLLGFALSYFLYGLVVILTWSNMEKWAYFRTHPDSFMYEGNVCHLPPIWVKALPIAFLPLLLFLFFRVRTRFRTRV